MYDVNGSNRDDLEFDSITQIGFGGDNATVPVPLGTLTATDALDEPLFVDDILAAKRDDLREPSGLLGRSMRRLRDEFTPFPPRTDRVLTLATVG